MSALDKVIAATGTARPGAPAGEDGAAELVLAAASALDDLRVLLAKAASGDDDQDDDSGDDDQDDDSGDDHTGHATYKALIKKKVAPKQARKMCAKADSKAEMSALCEAAVVALAGLDCAAGSWVERTACDTWTVALAGNSNTSQGAGEDYADAGYQKDGKKRYPVTQGGKLSQERIRSAWSYINQGDNAGEYSSEQLAKIKAKIKAAATKAGVKIADDGEKVAATMVELAASGKMTSMEAESHPPYHGTHAHKHVHHGDNMHGGMSDRLEPRGW